MRVLQTIGARILRVRGVYLPLGTYDVLLPAAAQLLPLPLPPPLRLLRRLPCLHGAHASTGGGTGTGTGGGTGMGSGVGTATGKGGVRARASQARHKEVTKGFTRARLYECARELPRAFCLAPGIHLEAQRVRSLLLSEGCAAPGILGAQRLLAGVGTRSRSGARVGVRGRLGSGVALGVRVRV